MTLFLFASLSLPVSSTETARVHLGGAGGATAAPNVPAEVHTLPQNQHSSMIPASSLINLFFSHSFLIFNFMFESVSFRYRVYDL